jgi:hypothetical protein
MDFVEAAESEIERRSILIVVIVDQWLTTVDEMGWHPDDPNDFVRLQIASALKKNLRVIPVLVEGQNASPPTHCQKTFLRSAGKKYSCMECNTQCR